MHGICAFAQCICFRMCEAVFRTNKVIARLEEEKKRDRGREKKEEIPLALIITSKGLLTNSCIMFVEDPYRRL